MYRKRMNEIHLIFRSCHGCNIHLFTIFCNSCWKCIKCFHSKSDCILQSSWVIDAVLSVSVCYKRGTLRVRHRTKYCWWLLTDCLMYGTCYLKKVTVCRLWKLFYWYEFLQMYHILSFHLLIVKHKWKTI